MRFVKFVQVVQVVQAVHTVQMCKKVVQVVRCGDGVGSAGWHVMWVVRVVLEVWVKRH